MRLYFANAYDAGSLDAKVRNTDGEQTLLSLISTDENMLENLYDSFRQESVEKLLKHLSDADQRLVVGYYGMVDGVPMTLQALAKETGVSRERVRQRIARSLRKLKISAELRQHF